MEDAIGNIHQILPDILIGAGTILTVKQVESAYQAGARFIVTPEFNEEVVEYCISNKIPIIPGCYQLVMLKRYYVMDWTL